MARTKRQYVRVNGAEKMIADLCTTYSDELWRVRPSSVVVLGIDNSTRSEKNKTLAKTRLIKGVEKALLDLNNIKVQYVIELYVSDWNDWTEPQRQWILFRELLHVHEEGDKLVKHDCEDFNLLIDAAGVKWVENKSLPNMLVDGDKIDFDLNLRPGLEEYGETDGSDDPVNQTTSEEDELVFDPEE